MLHLIKLCVGVDRIEELVAWQDATYGKGNARHVTRMWPKRADEVLDGGSLYWVIKGQILCRQRIVDLKETTGADGISRCAIVLDRQITHVAPSPKRPFQGWRYLDPKDAPIDITAARAGDDTLPAELAAALAAIGVR